MASLNDINPRQATLARTDEVEGHEAGAVLLSDTAYSNHVAMDIQPDRECVRLMGAKE
jgi:hypothetical protein